MKPTCKLCGKGHWLDEGHQINTSVPTYVREKGALGRESSTAEAVLAVRPIPNTAAHRGSSAVEPSRSTNKRTVLSGQNKRTRGRPKKWSSEAERKRAYRERSKG